MLNYWLVIGEKIVIHFCVRVEVSELKFQNHI